MSSMIISQLPASGPIRATREHHLQEAAEDYTELVAELIEEKGEARVVEIAKRRGISHVTAIKTIRRLVRDGYLTTSSHQPIELTAKGKKTAAISKMRHNLILQFLVAIGVSEKIAKIDAEGIEHHISNQTLRAMKAHLKRI